MLAENSHKDTTSKENCELFLLYFTFAWFIKICINIKKIHEFSHSVY